MTSETVTPDRSWCATRALGLEAELTDDQRADLARWVVAMRRAYASGTAQVTGALADGGGYCCLGLWCEIAETKGALQHRDLLDSRKWADAAASEALLASGGGWQAGNLPGAAWLAGSADPELFRFISREDVGDNPDYLESASDEDSGDWSSPTAAELNDDHGLSFGQIADLVAWSFGITAEELAAAELAPRVAVVEGAS